MQQALEYAETLDVPYVFSSNGDAFLFHDRTGQSHPVEREIGLNEFTAMRTTATHLLDATLQQILNRAA